MILVSPDEFTELRDKIMAQMRDAKVDRAISLEKQLKSEDQTLPVDIEY